MARIKMCSLGKRGRPTEMPNEAPDQQSPVAKRGRRTKADDGKSDNPPPQTRAFRFFDLPVEVRKQIFECCIPHGRTILMVASNSYSSDPKAMVVVYAAHGKPLHTTAIRNEKIHTASFLINKLFSNEARAVLYGGNTFSFSIDRDSHRSTGKSLHSLQIFGPFGRPHCLHLLRELKNIHILIGQRGSGTEYWCMTRLRARIEYFVSVLKEHSDDENQKSLLERLKVETNFPVGPQQVYSFEPLAALRGINNVELSKTVYSQPECALPSWFANCLSLCCRGQGGEVKPLEYPQVRVQPKKKPVTKKDKMIKARVRAGEEFYETTRRWYQPMLDWGEFAQRNGIEIPDDWCYPDNWRD